MPKTPLVTQHLFTYYMQSVLYVSVHVERYITNADMIMICSVVDSIDNNVTIEVSDDDNR